MDMLKDMQAIMFDHLEKKSKVSRKLETIELKVEQV